jgi:hypothetical protein
MGVGIVSQRAASQRAKRVSPLNVCNEFFAKIRVGALNGNNGHAGNRGLYAAADAHEKAAGRSPATKVEIVFN